MIVIFIAIDPVEVQLLREFRSEAYFVPPLQGDRNLGGIRLGGGTAGMIVFVIL
jgi:hypothetical protein